MKMNHYARCVTAGIVCTLMYGNLFAQETFDLSSQRSEKQDVRAVPGEKVDHKGFVLNPRSSNPVMVIPFSLTARAYAPDTSFTWAFLAAFAPKSMVSRVPFLCWERKSR